MAAWESGKGACLPPDGLGLKPGSVNSCLRLTLGLCLGQGRPCRLGQGPQIWGSGGHGMVTDQLGQKFRGVRLQPLYQRRLPGGGALEGCT